MGKVQELVAFFSLEQNATKSEVLLSIMRQHNLELFLSVHTEIMNNKNRILCTQASSANFNSPFSLSS